MEPLIPRTHTRPGRILALLIAVAMFVGALPVPAAALAASAGDCPPGASPEHDDDLGAPGCACCAIGGDDRSAPIERPPMPSCPGGCCPDECPGSACKCCFARVVALLGTDVPVLLMGRVASVACDRAVQLPVAHCDRPFHPPPA
jgi:hypothetical protein